MCPKTPTRVKDGASCRLGGGLLPHGLDDGLHLLPLPLGKVVRPDPLLQELQATLLLANPEQLLCPPLVGCEPDNFTDQVTHELVGLGQLTLVLGWPDLDGVLGRLVSLLHTDAHLIARSHFFYLL